jgi:hypothetical protein
VLNASPILVLKRLDDSFGRKRRKRHPILSHLARIFPCVKETKVERQLVGCQSNWGINSLALSADFQTIQVLVDPLQSFRKLSYPML